MRKRQTEVVPRCFTPSVLRDRGCFLSKEKEEHSGVVLVFLAAILYSLGGVCIKVIPWSGMSINSGRNLIALVVIGLYLWRVGHRPRFNPWIGLGAVAICGTNTLFTLANKMTTAANAIVLQFTAPIFVLLLTALVWRKMPRKGELVACGVVVLGVLCFFVDSLQAGGMGGNVVALIYHETIGPVSLVGAVIVIGGVVGYNVWKTKADGAQAVAAKS